MTFSILHSASCVGTARYCSPHHKWRCPTSLLIDARRDWRKDWSSEVPACWSKRVRLTLRQATRVLVRARPGLCRAIESIGLIDRRSENGLRYVFVRTGVTIKFALLHELTSVVPTRQCPV